MTLVDPVSGPGPQVPAGAGTACPACAAPVEPADAFCEECGAELAPAGRGPEGGGAPAPGRPGDHSEVDLRRVAGVSDRGLVHRENEDAMGLAVVPAPAGTPGAEPALVAVVCDGVSTVPGSGAAAAAAAAAATDTLVARLAAAPGEEDVGAAVREAARAGQRAIARPTAGEAPSCTFAAAVVAGGWLTVGWLGDSRVYLLGAGGAALRLTADDTVAAEDARAGRIPAELAETGRGAHTITRWLGPDAAGAVPHVAVLPLTVGGRVVVCSDGLWNYASAAADLAALVGGVPARAGPLAVARRLTAAALRAGGRDNVTVVVIDIPGSA